MRQLARRFTVDTYAPNGERFVPRLLPTPLFRFSQTEQNQSDGAVFAYAYGTNPEVILLLETAQTEEGLKWHYGLAPLTATEIAVRLDDREIWTQPKYRGPKSREVYLNGVFPPSEVPVKQ
jgi:hypothetical protein